MQRALFFALAAAFCAPVAHAQTAIDETAALAGGITPGDAPGYPVTLSAPGSYRLTGHLTAPPGQPAALIRVAADDVTLDLNGYTVRGATVCNADVYGRGNDCATGSAPPLIDIAAARVVLRNGYVEGSAGAGIVVADGLPADAGAVLEDLFVSNNAGDGIRVGVAGAAIRDVSASQNAGAGVRVAHDATIEGVRAAYNNGDGVDGAERVVASDIVASRNAGNGARILAGTVMRLSATQNGADGYAGGASVSYSQSTFNDGDGFDGAAMLTQSEATSNAGSGYAAAPAGGCYGNLRSANNAGGAIAAGTGFIGTLTVCP